MNNTIQISETQIGSNDWKEARELRFQLFFEKHGLKPEIMDDEYEKLSTHYVLKIKENVIAYLRLTELDSGHFSISQMVVRSGYQGKGFGFEIMNYALEEKIGSNFQSIVLNARLTAVPFYKRFGFVEEGDVFKSASTQVPHIKMIKTHG